MSRAVPERARRRALTSLAAAAALLPLAAGAATTVRHAVVGAGGGAAGGPSLTVRSTIGQPLVASAGGVTVTIGSGWWAPRPGGASGVPGELPPQAYRAFPNHPNPFNPRTTLAFDLPAAEARVSLRLFDLQGRLVASLVDGPLPAGRHQVAWTGVDDAGRAVASGVYVSVLESSHGRSSHKLTLVR